ncbi:trafficking protein particle complex subunit 10 [Xylaria bambusicola]|uniref:trafficking protein particle complex subunit 10 n=1 Tax=Xylaria bambusicola TaxID=326684 RepID=UPI002007E00D|nr:trafficking protein particle complex subunit 10 [Xylaria bambusicola]KAI0523902.1 trafficking protein particle complex subunit 10 [Xylaria bambusicola]
MEQPFSTSKVTVEYFDPHDVFKLLAPGLVPRLPLHNLHWQSHAGPLRSIETLHIELLPSGDRNPLASPITSPPPSSGQQRRSENDGAQSQIGAALSATQSNETIDQSSNRNSIPARRHQIPGLRQTPYLKVLLVRCDDNDSYKSHVRQEIRDWIKTNTPPSTSKKANAAENHDAFEWLIVHVVIPNTVAATQPRKSDVGSGSEKTSTASRWRPGSSTLLEKLRSDFNSSSKNATDHISQIRIGVNDVPYDSLPRVVPAVPTGYTETEQETENAWTDLISKFRGLILSSFDMRVTQYEEDIKEKDAQRSLPGWNFCTFFILKEGLARGFESVGLVEDALVGYDELSVGLDMIIKDQSLGRSGSTANTLLAYTEELKNLAIKAKTGEISFEGEQRVSGGIQAKDLYDDIPISANKKPYRDLIVANNVSIFDFRCYIFARQITLLLRLGNAWSTREELLAKLKEQQESVLHGVAPRAPPPKHQENEQEDLPMLAEICRRALEFIPSVSQVMRNDLLSALSETSGYTTGDDSAAVLPVDPLTSEVIDNLVVSFAFSTAQQILAQTSTKSLPIPSSSLDSLGGQESKAAIPEPKTMMHPARNSSLRVGTGGAGVSRPPPSPNVFSTGRPQSMSDHAGAPSSFLKIGLEDLAARRAELYTLSRNILEESGKKRGWSNGWADTPVVGQSIMVNMVDIDLGDEAVAPTQQPDETVASMAGIDNKLLKTALDNSDDFYRLYEILTDKALRHYTVAAHTHSIQSTMADLAVLKYHLKDYAPAASYFWRTTPFFGESGWSLLELSMLIMYSRCLKQLQRKDEYIKVLLKLLSKAATAEKDRRRVKPSLSADTQDYLESEEIQGCLGDLLSETKTILNEMRIPLSNFFASIEVDEAPRYDKFRDSLTLRLKLDSLLVEDLNIDSANLRLINASSKPIKEMWLKQEGPITIRPGTSRLNLKSNALIPGSYEVDRIDLRAGKLYLYFDREFGYPSDKSSLLRSPQVFIYHPTDTLDVRLYTPKSIQLDRSNSIDIELDTGWNDIQKAEVRIKAATGGLRLISSEAKCHDSSIGFSRPPEGGMLCFGSIPARTKLRIQFPYTLEQDTPNIHLRIEVKYETEHGSFFFSKTPSVRTSLALGVNVQDVFKHKILLSRFTVSTASPSPLRLFKSELIGSKMFESSFGVPPSDTVIVFPKQPASLLYKIKRKLGVKNDPKMSKTMYLKLHYQVLRDEIETLIENSLVKALEGTSLHPLSRLVVSTVLPLVRNDLTSIELERAALLGVIYTSFLSRIVEEPKVFYGLGKDDAGVDLAKSLTSFLAKWQTDNPTLVLPPSSEQLEAPSSILIPVDTPSVTIVHTADIRLQQSLPDKSPSSPAAAVCTHQLLPATLHLKWTRMWDTLTPPSSQTDVEFSYELSAPTDSWLIGGRRKGHFVIPAPSTDDDDEKERSSSVDTEAEIPVLLVPLREGWIPFPSVEIREVTSESGNEGRIGGGNSESSYETDARNLGETVRVIADRSEVTLSLDASGASGGPLVLDVKRGEGERVLVA